MESQAAELKQQGALEAARDSNSNVTAEDAERKMVEETRRAGAQAYLFNPDASPEEKAAQARSVRHQKDIYVEWKANSLDSVSRPFPQAFTIRRSRRLWVS